MTPPRERSARRRRVLVVGLGNADRGDDAIGPLVADALAARLSPQVSVVKCGGDPVSLLDRLVGVDALLCIDAAQTGAAPGTVHRIDLATGTLPREYRMSSSHSLGLAQAIALARELGTSPRIMIVYAIEAGGFDLGAPVTPAVAAALPTVVRQVSAELERLQDL